MEVWTAFVFTAKCLSIISKSTLTIRPLVQILKPRLFRDGKPLHFLHSCMHCLRVCNKNKFCGMRHHLQENHEIKESEPGTDYFVYTISSEPQEAFQQSQLTAPMSTSKLGEPKTSLQRHVGETNLLAFV